MDPALTLAMAANAAVVADYLEDRIKGRGRRLFAGLDPNVLVEKMRESPLLEEIITMAAERAARSVTDDRIDLLRRAIEKGLAAETDTEIEEAHFYTRTLVSLEVVHLTVLKLVLHQPGIYPSKLAPRYPPAERLVDLVLAHLQREGIVGGPVSGGATLSVGESPIQITQYGQRFAKWAGLLDNE